MMTPIIPAGLRSLCRPLVLGIDCDNDSVISARYEARILLVVTPSAALLRSAFIVRAGPSGQVLQAELVISLSYFFHKDKDQ